MGQIRELYRAAGLDSGDPTQAGTAESGIAKAFRFNDLSANLSALADSVEAAWNITMYIIAKTMGQPHVGNVNMSDDFSPPSFGDELLEMIQTVSAGSIPRVVKQNVLDRFVNRNLTLSEDDRVAYEMERERIGLSPLAELTYGVGEHS